jgi:transcriptional regulator
MADWQELVINPAWLPPLYIPQAFREERPEVLRDFIRRRPLGALVCTTPEGLTANHIPMILVATDDGQTLLRGHVARANSLWKITPDTPVLVIFGGAEHYITPSWYPTKQQHGKVVPTWNYSVVHAHGTVRFTDDRDLSLQNVNDLTNLQEAPRSERWAVSDAPAAYIDSMLAAIVAFEIQVTRLIGKFKASQHRPEDERQAVLQALEEEGMPAAGRLEVVRNPKSTD